MTSVRYQTITNDFHETETKVMIHIDARGEWISRRQARAAHDRLCGFDDCRCGDGLGARPTVVVIEVRD